MRGLLQSSERRTFEAASRQIATVFRQGIDEGVFRPSDPAMLANMYLGLIKGVLQSRPDLQQRHHQYDLRRAILDTFLNGVSVEKASVG